MGDKEIHSMAPKINHIKVDPIYQRPIGQIGKKKTFLYRINFEKSLPPKKRMFPTDLVFDKPRFMPTPYEKPVTRSQGRRGNSSNKENQAIAAVKGKVS